MPINYDDTIPHETLTITSAPSQGSSGVAGTVAVVGCFERGDGNTPYYARNLSEALRLMGDSADYSGTEILQLLNMKDYNEDGEIISEGATDFLCVKAGDSEPATTDVIDTTQTPVTIMTLALRGGSYGNTYTITIEAGSVSGKKFTLKDGSETLESYDNVADAEELYVILKNQSTEISNIIVGDLTKTLKNVTAQAFSGGDETSSPTTTDIGNALTAIEEDEYDYLVFTDELTDTYYASVESYLDDRWNISRATLQVLPIDLSKNKAQRLAIAAAADSENFYYNLATWVVDGERLTEAQTAALLTGWFAGRPVQDKIGNVVINHIEEVSELPDTTDRYDYIDGGINVIKLKNRQNKQYVIISPVTGNTSIDPDAGIKLDNEWYERRVVAYVVNELSMADELVEPSNKMTAINNLVNQKCTNIINDGVVESLDYSLVVNPDNAKQLLLYLRIKPFNVFKVISKVLTIDREV